MAKPSEKPIYPMRINKYLALHGYSTRRGADKLITDKLVFVNGKPAKLGDKVAETDKIEVKRTGREVPYIYVAYNKPRGVMTHTPQHGEKEIKDLVPIKGIFPVGRLDKESHGLIILTNDGRITDRLLGPSYRHEKEYVVKTKNKLRTSFKDKMEAGVQINAEMTAPTKVQIQGDNLFKIILTEGKKHQIRRMCDALFQEVADLKRVRIMNIRLGNLPEGGYREIVGEELIDFLSLLELA